MVQCICNKALTPLDVLVPVSAVLLAKVAYLVVFQVRTLDIKLIHKEWTINSMTPLVSNKVHLFTGCRDIPKGKPWAFHFLKKVTYGFLDELVVILENKVVQNLKLKNVFDKKWSPKLTLR